MRCLHDRGYSKPSLTALYGRSAGGFTVGTFCNVSPELVQAAILKVCAACGGVLDVCVCVCVCVCMWVCFVCEGFLYSYCTILFASINN